MKIRALILILLMTLAGAMGAAERPGASVAHGSEEVAQEAAHGETAHHEPKTYFGIPGWILKLVNMLLFLGLLIFVLKGPIGSAFKARGEQIRSELAEAKERQAKSDRLASEIQQKLNQIEADVAAILQRAQEEGERQKSEILTTARAEAEKILAGARNEVEARVKQAQKELTAYAGQLATERAKALVAESINEADRKRLFSSSVESLEDRA